MNESTQEDFVNAIEDLTEAVRRFKIPEPPAARAPIVNVAPASVSVDAPEIHFEQPRGAFIVTVTERDFMGRLKEITITPK